LVCPFKTGPGVPSAPQIRTVMSSLAEASRAPSIPRHRYLESLAVTRLASGYLAPADPGTIAGEVRALGGGESRGRTDDVRGR
jgi:hypothetical protein